MLNTMNIGMMCFLLTISFYSVHAQRNADEASQAFMYGAQARFTLKVTDPNGQSVENAVISLGYAPPYPKDMNSPDYIHIDKRPREIHHTDMEGVFTHQVVTLDQINYRISKSGYYESTGLYRWPGKTLPYVIQGRWQPWNPTIEIMLKPVINPVPMYAKIVSTDFPLLNQPIGFDFECGDWVQPYGRGKTADFTVTYNRETREGPRNYLKKLTLNFPGEMDGIQIAKLDNSSQFKSAYQAPLEGYQKQIVFMYDRTRTKNVQHTKLAEDEYLIFRVRTETGKQGELVRANYGRIGGAIHYGGGVRPEKSLRFRYYFNPDHTRNLEHDPKKNLMEGFDGQP